MPEKKSKKTNQLTEEQVQGYINGIYEGKITPENLSEEVYNQISKHLEDAVYTGYGLDLKQAYGEDHELLQQLRDNVYMFGAAKDYQMTKEMSGLLVGEDGKLRTNKQFNKVARELYKQWNDNWGETEYSTAVGQAYSAVKWQEIERQKKVLPNLRYLTIGDACEICAPLNNLVAPIDDPIWDMIGPLNHFNCKCILLQEGKEAELSSDEHKSSLKDNISKLMNPIFMSNPAKDGMIFNKFHPFFQVDPSHAALALRNFDMPMPPEVSDPGKPETLDTYEKAQKAMSKIKPTASEQNAIQSYTGTDYDPMNRFLRSGDRSVIPSFAFSDIQRNINQLSGFLNRSPKVGFETYRGLTFTKKEFDLFLNDIKDDSIIVDKGFMSTSAKKIIADRFADSDPDLFTAFINIKGKSGILIERYSSASEREVLFNKGSKFKVESVKHIKDNSIEVNLTEI